MSMNEKKSVFACSDEILTSFDSIQTPCLPALFYRCKNDELWTANFIGSHCEEVLECERKKLISHEINFGDLIIESDQNLVGETVQLALNKQCSFQLLYHMKTPEGSLKIIYEQGEGVFDGSGSLVELMGFLTDITKIYKITSFDYGELLKTCVSEINSLKADPPDGSLTKSAHLSLREVETLLYLCKGMTMKEIGARMHISSRTVEMNIRHAKLKLSCHSQSELRNLFYETSCGRRLISEKSI